MGKRTAFQIAVSAIENGEFGPEQDKAIALMNAAPDLLQALETLLNNLAHGDDTQQAQTVAHEAIARARGQ